MPATQTTPFDKNGISIGINIIRRAKAMRSIEETVTYINGDLEREIRLNMGPNFITELAEGRLPKDQKTLRVPVLIATPRKGSLRSVTDLRDGSDKRVDLVSHEDHLFIAKTLLTTLLWTAYSGWRSKGPEAEDRLAEIQTLLHTCVGKSAPVAAEILADVFDADGRLIDHADDVPRNERLEKELHQAALLVAERYLLMADCVFDLAEEPRLQYTHRTVNHERRERRWDRFTSMFGGHPPYVRLPLPWARRTDSYHIRLEVPPGHYAMRRFAAYQPERAPTPGRKGTSSPDMTPLPKYKDRSADNGVTGQESPSIARPHILVTNGTRATKAIGATFLIQERPLGSAGVAWLTCALTTLVAAGLFILGATVPLAEVTSPALVLALIGAIGAFSTTAFKTEEDSSSSVLSKVLVFVNALLAIVFCWTWMVLQSRSDIEETLDLKSKNGYLLISLLVGLILIVTAATVRARKALKNFHEVTKYE